MLNGGKSRLVPMGSDYYKREERGRFASFDGAKHGWSKRESRYQRADQWPLVRALHVLPTIGDETLYLIDSPQTCVTTTSYCL